MGRPRVRVSPLEARRWELMAVVCAEWQDKMWMLERGSMGPRFLSWGVFKYCLVLTIPCHFSCPEGVAGPQFARVVAW